MLHTPSTTTQNILLALQAVELQTRGDRVCAQKAGQALMGPGLRGSWLLSGATPGPSALWLSSGPRSAFFPVPVTQWNEMTVIAAALGRHDA